MINTKIFSTFYKYAAKIFLFVFFFNHFVLPQTQTEDLIKYIKSYQKNKDIPSISAGLLMNAKTTWTYTTGLADIENNVSATNKTVYRIASISKMMTAVAIMQLVEKGKINLDEDIRKYVSYYPQKKWKFSVRQILTHTSGIRTYNGEEFDNKTNFSSVKDAVMYIADDSLKFEPGTKYLYSTLSYNLLAAAIENVTGQSYFDYMKENIFKPAGMNTTYFDFYNQIIPNRASGYTKNRFRKIENAPLADLTIKFPGGGILSNIDDMLKFAKAIFNNTLIKKSTLDSMLVPVKLSNGETKNYGLGISIGVDNEKRKFFGHSGAGTGFVSQILFYPDEKIAAVHLMNLKDRNLDNLAQSLVMLVLRTDVTQPKKSLADAMINVTNEKNIDSAIVFYKIVKSDSTDFYVATKEELKIFGYDLLTLKRNREALYIFTLLVEEYPDFIDGYIGLGDAYFHDNNKGLAIKNYRLALKINPENNYCLRMIDNIGKMK